MVRFETRYEYFWVATLRLLARRMSPSRRERLAGSQPRAAEAGGQQGRPLDLLVDGHVVQAPDLLAVCAEDIVLAAGKVRVDLAGQQGVLRDVGAARVVVQRQDEQPGDADDEAQGGEVGRDPEQAGVAPERQQRGCLD